MTIMREKHGDLSKTLANGVKSSRKQQVHIWYAVSGNIVQNERWNTNYKTAKIQSKMSVKNGDEKEIK